MKTMRALLTAIAAAALLGGCLGGGGNQTFNDGFYRFIHVSPGTGSVAISVNGNPVTSSLGYHSATANVEFGWGAPPIQVTSANGSTTYINSNIPVAGDGHYSYFIYGSGSTVVGLPIRDDVSDAPSGKFYLRGINLATGLGALDVYLLPAGATIPGTTASLKAVAYAGTSGFVQFTTGTYDVVLTATGSTDVIYDSGPQTFNQNAKVSIVAYSAGSGRLANGALLLDDGSGTTNFVDSTAARYKFAGMATDVQPLDLLIDGSVALGNVAYGGTSDYLAIGAGSHRIQIQPTSTPGAYVYDQTLTFGPATDNSLAAYSVAGTGAAGLIATADNNIPSPTTGKAKLRIVNASSDDSAYDVFLGSTKLLSGVAQGTIAAYQEVSSGTYTVSFDPAGTTTPAATIDVTLAGGKIYTIYAYGRSGAAFAALTEDY